MISDKTKMVFLLIAGFVLFLAACGKGKEEKAGEEVVRPIKMMTVTSSSDAIQLKFPGRVRAAKRADLAFQRVEGRLSQLPVDEGQAVKKGQLIAQLDQRDFRNNLRDAQGQLAKAKAALESAQSEYDRILRIQKKDPGAASESMVVKRREAVDQSKAQIVSAQAAVDIARDELGYTTLRAPFGGVVSKRYVDNYQEVRAKEPIVSLDDIFSVEILVDVPELIVARFKEGEETQVQAVAEFAAAPGKQYPLMVKERAKRADPKTQTYQVVFRMPQPDDINVLPGMTATVTGSARMRAEAKEVFIVPAIAVVADAAGNPNVWVVDKETLKVQRRAVKIGDLTGTDSIEIIDGLKFGETIAISGVSRLREGMQVSDLSKMEGYKP